MGCPDWPKCFEQWVPPTSIDQLPSNYKEIHSSKRGKKIEKFAALLENLGFAEKAREIRTDPTLLIEEDFNAKKTWTEYLNRVLGVFTGLFAILFTLSAFQFRKSDKRKFLTAIAGFVFILINGWLGSIVVATNLLPGVVSIHFLLAFIAAAFVMVATHNGFEMYLKSQNTTMKRFIWIAIIITLVQILGGTLVRENIDYLLKTNPSFKGSSLNESLMNGSILFHKIWSWLVLGFGLFFFYYIKLDGNSSNLLKMQWIVLGVWFMQFCTGVINLWWALPTLSQVIHIVGGSILLGIQMYICIAFYNKFQKVS